MVTGIPRIHPVSDSTNVTDTWEDPEQCAGTAQSSYCSGLPETARPNSDEPRKLPVGGDSSQESLMLNQDDLTTSGHMTFQLFFSVIVITFGSSFQFGYGIGAINAPAQEIQHMINKSHYTLAGSYMSNATMDVVWGTAVSIFPIGALVGSLFCGYFADRFGRRLTLHTNNVLSILAAVAMTISKFIGPQGFYPLFHIGRFLIGLNAGIGSCIAPLYVTELSPIRLRGAVGSVPQLVVTISILVSQIVGLRQLLGTEDLWPFIFALMVIPSAFQIVLLFFVPESPKYSLCLRNDRRKAFEDLQRLRGGCDSKVIEAELDVLRDEMEQCGSAIGVRQLFTRALIWRTIISCVLMVAQQFSGMNSIMFYSTEIFEKNVFPNNQDYAIYCTVGVGAVNVLTTIVSIRMVEHPRMGRRFLLLFGNIGMLISMVLLSVSLIIMDHAEQLKTTFGYIAIVFVVTFVICFASGPGSIPFFYVSEIFASDARASASAITIATNWVCAFVVGLGFPSMQSAIDEYSFFVFAGFLAAATVFTALYVPETKGKQLHEITEEIDGRRPACS